MDLRGRRESTNVDDRRGLSGKAIGGMGIGGIIIVGLIYLIMGRNPMEVLQNADDLDIPLISYIRHFWGEARP